MDGIESRRSVRVNTGFRVELCFPEGGWVDGTIKDVSLSGIYVCCDWPKDLYMSLEVKIYLDGAAPPVCLRSGGKVVRHGEDGVAVELVHTDKDSLVHLLKLLAYNRGDSQLAADEAVRLGLTLGG